MPEIVRIPDARSMAEGLNRGAKLASGKWLAFIHDDILFLGRDTPKVIGAAMANCDMFGPCGTIRLVSGNWYDAGRPYVQGQVVAPLAGNGAQYELQHFGGDGRSLVQGAQALDGIFIACTRDAFDALGGFDEVTYDGFLGYDVDISFRAAIHGFRVAISCGMVLLHDSRVEHFEDKKMRAWEEKQRAFVQAFGSKLATEAGERTHVSIPLRHPEDATAIVLGRKPPPFRLWPKWLTF
jgi:GT2 family glycosyltransferase